jgi:hypothetical protein
MKTSEYSSWAHMIERCYNVNAENYDRYGGIGITVCESWRISFANFVDDMGNKPGLEYTLQRIDNKNGYYPDNCKWMIVEEQNPNRPNFNKLKQSQVDIIREIAKLGNCTQTELGAIFGVHNTTISRIISRKRWD